MANFELDVKQTQGNITFDVSKLKKDITNAIKPYEKLVVTEDGLSEAKGMRAKLNKLEKAINDKKIEVKKDYLEPYTQFENEVKEIIGIIRQGTLNIDTQVKSYEEQAKVDKKEDIKKFYESIAIYKVDFDKLFDEKWLNSSVNEKSWKEQLSSKVESIKVNLKIIQNMNYDDLDLLKNLYLDTLNLDQALNSYTRLKPISKPLESDLTDTLSKPIDTAKVVPQALNQATEPNTLVRAFKVTGTKEQIIELGEFMSGLGVKFEKIEL